MQFSEMQFATPDQQFVERSCSNCKSRGEVLEFPGLEPAYVWLREQLRLDGISEQSVIFARYCPTPCLARAVAWLPDWKPDYRKWVDFDEVEPKYHDETGERQLRDENCLLKRAMPQRRLKAGSCPRHQGESRTCACKVVQTYDELRISVKLKSDCRRPLRCCTDSIPVVICRQY